MPYVVNLHEHVKIWLSPDKNVFLPKRNQDRLREMRKINPVETDTIYFFYDSSLLSPKALDDLKQFCDELKIIPKDLRRMTLPAECYNEDVANAVQCYNEEIQLENGGNLGAASDIARLITYRYGIYTDLDVIVDARHLPPTMEIQKPVLFSIGSHLLFKNAGVEIEGIDFNGDIIIASKSEETHAFMQNLCKGVHEAYTENCYEKEIETFKTNIQEICKRSDFNPEKTIQWETLFNELALTELKALSALGNYFPWEIRQLTSQLTDEQIPNSEVYKLGLLMEGVKYTSGSGMLINKLFGKYFIEQHDFDREIAPYSINFYGLNKAFISDNSVPMHDRSPDCQTQKAGDLSWTPMGKKALDKGESIASSVSSNPQTLYNANSAQSLRGILNKMTEPYPDAVWTYYNARTDRPAQILLTVKCKQTAETIRAHLEKHQVKGLGKLKRDTKSNSYALQLIEPDATFLKQLPTLPKAPMSQKEFK